MKEWVREENRRNKIEIDDGKERERTREPQNSTKTSSNRRLL